MKRRKALSAFFAKRRRRRRVRRFSGNGRPNPTLTDAILAAQALGLPQRKASELARAVYREGMLADELLKGMLKPK